MAELTQIGVHPIDVQQDPIECETCGTDVLGAWYGSVEERDWLTGLFMGYSYHCMRCTNVLARMADAVGALAGPDGNRLILNEQGNVNTDREQ